jgi:UDP-glucose:(heptosyl)LPS alpha-1,3-glucosyltransferase
MPLTAAHAPAPGAAHGSTQGAVGGATLAFCLFRYFPFGGLQRDFLRIARLCAARGARVRVYVLSWQGSVPDGFEVVHVPRSGLQNHTRCARYIDWVHAHLARHPVALVVGFNRMPGLDVYYAADACYAERAAAAPALRRLLPRHRFHAACERAVCGAGGARRLLLLSPLQQAAFSRHYATAAARMTLLAPCIDRDRAAGDDAADVRAQARQALGVADDEHLLLALGSGYRTKGLDRAIRALAALPEPLRARTHLLAVGDGTAPAYLRLARRLGVGGRVCIERGRDDVPRLLQAADLLVHAARVENTGTVLVEAIVAGLPVLATGACGYAAHVRAAGAGRIVEEPFSQAALDAALASMLGSPEERSQWRRNGIAYGRTADVYGGAAQAVRCILELAAAQPGGGGPPQGA